MRLARVTKPGAVFGEMSALLDRPHAADVRAHRCSTLHVVEDAKAFLEADPAAALDVALILAQRLDALTSYLIDVRSQFRALDDHVG